MLNRFTDLVIWCAQNKFSDLHICGGQPVIYRKDGLIRFDQKLLWAPQHVDSLAESLLNSKNREVLRRRLSVDFAVSIGNVRLRVNIFSTGQGLSMAIRLLPDIIPTIEQLNLHPSIHEISDLKSGLVLICGTTGSGKTTTIASILDDINHKRAAHIITLEDPVEFQIPSRKSFVEQREVGEHVPSFERGLIDVMRADPDVIMVGELRDPQTIALTLNVAESGHLVIATLHATNMEDALYRIINSAPPEAEEYIRHQLASTISWIMLQKLVYSEKIGFRLPVLSIMRGTSQIKGLIRDKKLFQIENAMHTSKTEGMFTEARYLTEYLEKRDRYHTAALIKPEKGAVVESQYTSRLLHPEGDDAGTTALSAPVSAPDKSSSAVKDAATAHGQSEISYHDDEVHYSIDENYDLSEIIAEAEKKMHKKSKT